MNVPIRRRLAFLLITAAMLAMVFATTVLAAVATLAPRTLAWTLPLRVHLFGHPLQQDVSVPVLLRWLTHPLAAPVINGRHIDTVHGRWQLSTGSPEGLVATCAPCNFTIAALGPAPLALERVELTISAEGADQYHGRLRLGSAPHTIALSWRGGIDRSDRMQLEATLAPTPLRHAVQVFGTALAERASVQVEGSLSLALGVQLPDGPWRVQPRIDNFVVQGLGTERWLDLQRPAACRQGSDGSVTPVGGWLPRAVIAAEDQRFFEHPGYDLGALTEAWRHNQHPQAALVGASTLTQQLAKLVVTGDDRSAARKLRELLYAVEMERTLGKARILQLYLALAPWGGGVCGAERAVRVHLGQRDASTVGPLAAAWLASLLPQPDALLRAEQQRAQVDAVRVSRVIEAMRPMNAQQRDKALASLASWSPPALNRPREGSPPPAGAPP